MSALRVACRTPWGEEHDLVVLHGTVIVPRQLGHVPSLWWLRGEHHPHLAVTFLSVLEQETGAELGLSPYCLPIERWNEAANQESWLPVVPASIDAGSFVQRSGVTVLPASPQLQSLPIPRRAAPRVDLDFDGNCPHLAIGARLRAGSYAVSRVFGGLRQLVVAGALGGAVLACAYYVIAATLWLWSLRDGMTGGKIQEGVVLILAALLFSAFTRLFRERLAAPQGDRALPYRDDGQERQPLLYTVLDGYRIGVSLQLLAFGAFVIF